MPFAELNTWLSGSGEPYIISGPCGAETRDQVMTTAKQLSELNRVSLFRAGVWKPRTRPNAFEGKGEEALLWLKEVQQTYKFKTTVEVANASHTDLALKHGVDVLWIGARTTVNPFTVQEIADALKGVDVPVLIKNPVHPELGLWIGAIERILNSGITKIAAVHRGFHHYGTSKFRNEPMWQIPIELKTTFPKLPIICDPSHISGKRELLQFVSQKALDLNMNGLMIESHYDPSVALSDAAQQLTPAALGKLLSKLVIRKKSAEGKIADEELLEFRTLIDAIDEELIQILKKRVKVIEKIGHYKKDHGITIFQLQRWQEILRTRGAWAEKEGLSRSHLERICQLLHEESIRIQNELMNK
jgi:chorismate mutase